MSYPEATAIRPPGLRFSDPGEAFLSGSPKPRPKKIVRKPFEPAVQPAPAPKLGADFGTWFQYLVSQTARCLQNLNHTRWQIGLAPRGDLKPLGEKFGADLLWLRSLLGSEVSNQNFDWPLSHPPGGFHFLLYPDRTSSGRQFELTARFVSDPERNLVSDFSLEMVDHPKTLAGDRGRRYRGPVMQMSSSSSYLATPPPSG